MIGNPLVSRIMFFEKASSALRLVKASLEKETPQYVVDNTNVEQIFRNRERLDKLRDEIRRKTQKLAELKSVYKFMKPAPEVDFDKRFVKPALTVTGFGHCS